MKKEFNILSFRIIPQSNMRKWVIGIVVCFSQSLSQQFTEVSVEMGVQNYLYVTGIAWIDYNNDNQLDLYLTTRGFGFPINGVPQFDLYNNLYKNIGNGFENVTIETNTGIGPGQSRSTAWADYNQDGWIDLFAVNGIGVLNGLDVPNALYQNNGGYFTDVGSQLGVDLLTQCVQVRDVSWSDFDNNGTPDFIIVQQIESNNLFKNNINHFEDVAFELGIIDTFNYPNHKNAEWGDYDNDGDLDLFIAASSSPNLLYRNDLDNTGLFTEIASEVGINNETIILSFYSHSYGANWVDYDNDGDLDLYIINYTSLSYAPYTNRLYRNDISTTGLFIDIAEELGLADSLYGLTSSWADYDNDGDLDLLISNNTWNQLRIYRNDLDNNIFTIIEDFDLTGEEKYYSIAWGDYDNDGDMDFYVGDISSGINDQFNALYRNNQNDYNYLKIRFLSSGGGYSRQGSRIWVYRENTNTLVGMREIVSRSVNSQDMYDVHFGLDGNFSYDIVIRSTVRINGENIILNKYNRPELGGVIPIDIGGFLEVRDSVDVSLDINDDIIIPEKVSLKQNYPNPFNINTKIDFTTPVKGDVQLSIYNLKGQILKQQNFNNINAGSHSYQWNGVDENGNDLPTGIYLYELQNLETRITKKMVLMK